MKKKLFAIFLIALLLFSLSGFSNAPVAYAATPDVIDFDYTYVLDDLVSSTVYNEEFNVAYYPADLEGNLQLLSFAEYAYSSEAARRGHYGLYLYLYNPQGIEFPASSLSNKIQIAVAYNSHGSPTDYEKFDLKVLSVSSAPFLNRFIKLKVVDHKSADGKTIAARVSSSARRYDISGFELLAKDAINATEYSINRTFTYSGFAKGYGNSSSEESTLACAVAELETIDLKVHHTYFRTGLSSLGLDHENQLDSVYFGVDNRFLEEYGRLQRVKAEWFEYKTKPIVVTQNESVYNNLNLFLGQEQTEYEYALYYNKSQKGYPPVSTWDWAYTGSSNEPTKTDRALYYLYYVPDIKEFDPRGIEAVVGGVKSNLLYQHVLQYDKSFAKGTLPIKNGTISADLFEDAVDTARVPLLNELEAGRKRGYYVHDFDADVDLHQLPSYNSTNPDFMQKVKDFGFWETILNDLPVLDDDYKDVSPIYKVSSADLLGSNEDISTRLLIRKEDVQSFKTFFSDESAVGREVFLFRFAATDYFSGPLMIQYNDFFGEHQIYNEAYVAQETVFLDFDIIQLTFNKNGVYRVIPVVNNPIDAVADITPPAHIPEPPLNQFFNGIKDFFKAEMPQWLRILIWVVAAIVAAAVLILLLPILIPLFKWIFKGLWWFITLPVKATQTMIKGVKKRKATKAKRISDKAAKKALKANKPPKVKKVKSPKSKKPRKPRKPKAKKVKIQNRQRLKKSTL